MARWTDLAQWRGPTVNEGDGDGRAGEPEDRMVEQRGVVIHIAAGYYEGTISWQKNADANVSSHFVVSKTGKIAQMVDTDIRAWTQRDGNGHWLSVENEGFAGQALTAEQVEANSKIFARWHKVYGGPLQLATSPTGRGLGHHSMGAENGYNWGHSECPGPKIKAQKPAILARAKEIANGEIDMPLTTADADLVAGRLLGRLLGKSGPTVGVALQSTYGTVQALAGKDFTDEAAIVEGVLAGLSPEAIAAAIPAGLARQVADELAARLQG